MNMFHSKEKVDEHVKKLLSITKNSYDNDMQCSTIAKLYFDVNEYKIAKTYIDRYIKIKDNSQFAIKLKAKVHEKLSEYDMAVKCYEKLFDLFSEECDASKVCECLMKCEDVHENKIKKWIGILEKRFPKNENYSKLKSTLSPNTQYNYTMEEIDDLKTQIKTNVKEELKIRFLRILENQNGVIDSLSELSTMMNTYCLVDNGDYVKLALSVYKKHYKPEHVRYKPFYAILLLSALRNHGKLCDYDRAKLLEDLLSLLRDQTLDGIYKEILCQFVYHLTVLAHSCAIKENQLNETSSQAILRGYFIANSIDMSEKSDFSPVLSSWLRNQGHLARSVSNHVVVHASRRLKCQMDSKQCFMELGNLIWKSYETSRNDLELLSSKCNSLVSNKTNDDTISKDLQAVFHFYSNLKLISWQMACYNNFPNQTDFSYDLDMKLFKFLGELSRAIFPKVSLISGDKASTCNISKVDLFTFMLGTLLSYQKSFNGINHDSCLPYPYEMWEEIHVPDVIHKWWHAACDFTLNQRRNTSVGALRDLLKSGLDSLQLIDNQMSEVLKIQLGKLLVDCSNFNEFEKEALQTRGIAFYSAVLRPNKSSGSSFKNLPISAHSYQNSIVRQRSFTSLTTSFNGYKTKELFDTDHVSGEIMEKWKLDGYLMIVNWFLVPSMVLQADFDELDELVECAEKINNRWPLVYLLKSRIFLERAQLVQTRRVANCSPNEFSRLLKLSQDSAHDGLDCLNELAGNERSMMHDLLQQHLNEVSHTQSLEYSIFEFTCTGETSNSNKFFNHSIQSNDLYNQSSVSNDHSNVVDNVKIEQLESEMAVIGTSQDKIGSEIGLCMSKVDNFTKVFTSEIREINQRSQFQQNLYSDLAIKLDNLSKNNERLVKLECKIDYVIEEKNFLEYKVNHLIETVNKLTVENAIQKAELEEMYMTSKIADQIEPEMVKINQVIGDNMQHLYNKVSNQLHQYETMQLLIPLCRKIQTHTNKLPLENSTKNENRIVAEANDKEAEWECPICECMIESDQSECTTCYTLNPLVDGGVYYNTDTSSATDTKTNNVKLEPLDISKINAGKWECKVCCCLNEEKHSQCPACQTPKTQIDAPITTAPAKLQLPFATNKTGSFTFGSSASPTSEAIKFGQTPDLNSAKETQSVILPIKNGVTTTNSKNDTTGSVLNDLSKINAGKWSCVGCYCMNEDSYSVCPACNTPNPSAKGTTTKVQLPFSVNQTSSFVFGSSTPSNAGTISFGKTSIPIEEQPSKIVFSGNSSESSIVFGSTKASFDVPSLTFGTTNPTVEMKSTTSNIFPNQTETTKKISPITFGKTVGNTLSSNSNLVTNVNYTNRNAGIDFKFGASAVNTSKLMDEKAWRCLCTTSNKATSFECIACGQGKNEMEVIVPTNSDESDSDSDVIITLEPYVTADQVERARKLMLPDHFYYYENLSGGEDSDSDDTESDYNKNVNHDSQIESKEDQKPFSFNSFLQSENKTTANSFTFGLGSNTESATVFGTFGGVKSDFGSTETSVSLNNKTEDENPENFNAVYGAIIDLPELVTIVTGEEGYDVLFVKRCKLYRYDNEWKDLGSGDMKILRGVVDGKVMSRLVMRREVVNKVCCNQNIVKNCPSFTAKVGSKTCVLWHAPDFSDGNCSNKQFAIKFSLEEDLDIFRKIIKDLQDEMEVTPDN